MKEKHIAESVPPPESNEAESPENKEPEPLGGVEAELPEGVKPVPPEDKVTESLGAELLESPETGSTEVEENQSATDFYVLFRDDSIVESMRITKSGVKVDYGEDGDTASYVWRHVGKLTDAQARYCQDKIRLEFKRRFRVESEAGKLDKAAKLKIHIAVLPNDEQDPKKYKGKYIVLLSFPNLVSLWQRPNRETIGNPLFCAVWRWWLEVSDSTDLFDLKKTVSDFNFFLSGQDLSPFQQDVLTTCADIIDRIQNACGGATKTGIDTNGLQILHAIESLTEVVKGKQTSITDTPNPKKPKPLGSGRTKIYDKRLPALLADIERRVYREKDPLHPADAYRYTKKKIAEELIEKYPDEFSENVKSVEKGIQGHSSWKKWYNETRNNFIGEDCGLDEGVLRIEKFEKVVYDYLAYIRDLKDMKRGKKYNGMYEEEDVGMNDEEYLKLANRLTTTMAAQWAKQREADYVEIGEIFRWDIGSLADEFAKTREWDLREETLGVTLRDIPKKKKA